MDPTETKSVVDMSNRIGHITEIKHKSKPNNINMSTSPNANFTKENLIRLCKKLLPDLKMKINNRTKREVLETVLKDHNINIEEELSKLEPLPAKPNIPKAKKDKLEKKETSINSANNPVSFEIKCCDALEYLKTIEDNSIDLILTDPPYLISNKNTGMDKFCNEIEERKQKNDGVLTHIKTEEEWEQYKILNSIDNDEYKENYLLYGTTYGSKYGVSTYYGEWDTSENFSMEMLEEIVGEYYKKLKKGGTLIMFFDFNKNSYLREMFERCKFKQLRTIIWAKLNPPPLNNKVNYLTNAMEYALLGVKGGKPTFNTSHHSGLYIAGENVDNDMGNDDIENVCEIHRANIQGGKSRFHPTQKSLKLFERLVETHSNEGDVVLDTFLGSGTTAVACCNLRRQFKGCELNNKYCLEMKKIFGLDFVENVVENIVENIIC
jgi:site-specific DNA-methyltransferase (adenine-specific)